VDVATEAVEPILGDRLSKIGVEFAVHFPGTIGQPIPYYSLNFLGRARRGKLVF
jgi:hypothetical protein